MTSDKSLFPDLTDEDFEKVKALALAGRYGEGDLVFSEEAKAAILERARNVLFPDRD